LQLVGATLSMDWKTFVSSMTSFLAWPIVVSILAITFRDEIRSIFKRAKKLGNGVLQIELADEIDKARDQAEKVQAEQSVPTLSTQPLDQATVELAKSSPPLAVLQSFKEVEAVLLAIRALLPDNKPHRNLNEVLAYLRSHEMITESVVALFQRLRKTTKAVSHAAENTLTQGETYELIGQSRLLTDVFKAVQSKLQVKSS